MSKYTLIAYILWLLFGWFGLHHFYLRRDNQGILWLTSFAGLFGIGWLRDFWRIPSYVADANEDPSYMEYLRAHISYNKRPPIWYNLHRIVGQILFGYFYRELFWFAIPEENASPALYFLLVPIGTAFGTYMVSNAGRIKSPFTYSLIGAYLGELLFGELHILYVQQSTPSFAVGVSMLVSTYAWDYRRHYEKHTCCKRLAVWMVIYLAFCGMCGSSVYFNLTVETQDGETVKVREALNNFFKSPAWQEIKKSFWMIWDEYKQGGWEGARRKMIILADVEGEERAFKILGLEEGASLKQIKERYRSLAKEWHPDHHQGEEAKLYAQERFMEVKEAYETLTKIYNRREKTA